MLPIAQVSHFGISSNIYKMKVRRYLLAFPLMVHGLISGCTLFASNNFREHMSKFKSTPASIGVVSVSPNAGDSEHIDYRNAKPMPLPSIDDESGDYSLSGDKDDTVKYHSSRGGTGTGQTAPVIIYKNASESDYIN